MKYFIVLFLLLFIFKHQINEFFSINIDWNDVNQYSSGNPMSSVHSSMLTYDITLENTNTDRSWAKYNVDESSTSFTSADNVQVSPGDELVVNVISKLGQNQSTPDTQSYVVGCQIDSDCLNTQLCVDQTCEDSPLFLIPSNALSSIGDLSKMFIARQDINIPFFEPTPFIEANSNDKYTCLQQCESNPDCEFVYYYDIADGDQPDNSDNFESTKCRLVGRHSNNKYYLHRSGRTNARCSWYSKTDPSLFNYTDITTNNDVIMSVNDNSVSSCIDDPYKFCVDNSHCNDGTCVDNQCVLTPILLSDPVDVYGAYIYRVLGNPLQDRLNLHDRVNTCRTLNAQQHPRSVLLTNHLGETHVATVRYIVPGTGPYCEFVLTEDLASIGFNFYVTSYQPGNYAQIILDS
jgi:hypothetical protein